LPAEEPTNALDENVEEIKSWERSSLLTRSRTEQISDWVAATASSGPALVLHLLWFTFWVCANTRIIRSLKPFDPFPFPFLTMAVSLEAIFLSLFVLSSQNRLSRQSDKRGHLDLQVNLLAEREMTAVLNLLLDIARHLKVETSVTDDHLQDLARRTDLHILERRLDELATPDAAPPEDTKRRS
jgi:uncharacterized membrane protein